MTIKTIINQSKFGLNYILMKDYDHYEGIRRIKIYVLRVLFALIFFFVVPESWSVIFNHEGPWDPVRAVAWCTWAAYSTLAILGVFHTLRMLPIMLFIVFYKVLWLIVVAYPLWTAGEFYGSSAEQMTYAFSLVILKIIFMPWKYVFETYVLKLKRT